MPVFVKASRRAKAYTRSLGAVYRSGLKQAAKSGIPGRHSKRATAVKNSIAWHLKYGKKRSPERRLQLMDVHHKLTDMQRG